jgi:5,10-methylenetetrahydrofolate reductase
VTTVTERCFEATGHTTFICDFSPPRTGDPQGFVQPNVDAEFISVAYNPGRSVRVNSAMLAAAISQKTGKDALFTLATRDMNKLALQSLLLGAQLLGLENVVVVQGDPFTQRDLDGVKDVGDFTSTGMIAAMAGMNQGIDYRGGQLRASTDFCIGATLDLTRGVQREARLGHRKVQAGAQFFIAQPIFDIADAGRFREAFASVAGEELALPVFFGLQILEQDGVIFSSVPDNVREELAGGRPGVDIALELYQRFQEGGLHNVYLVPPIRRGGARNYGAAREVLAAAARL